MVSTKTCHDVPRFFGLEDFVDVSPEVLDVSFLVNLAEATIAGNVSDHHGRRACAPKPILAGKRDDLNYGGSVNRR